jgi:VIT1/CCC1 family predicted Fe2+/Mn2+ transporter
MNSTFEEYLEYKRARKGASVASPPTEEVALAVVEDEVIAPLPAPQKQHSALPDAVTHAEPHSESHFGPMIKPIVYGGMDGLVSVFVGALIAVITGQPLTTILALTLGKLFAGAFSMGAGEYMSSKAEVDYATGERRREQWECENFIEGEKAEMVELYEAKGYSHTTAVRIVDLLAKDPALFVNAMMVEELEIPPEQEQQSPLKNMMVNFTAFLVFGTLPLLPFIVFIIGRAATCSGVACAGSVWNSPWIPLYISIGVTVLGVLVLASLKSKVTGIRFWLSVFHSYLGAILSVAFGAGLAYAIYYAVGSSV